MNKIAEKKNVDSSQATSIANTGSILSLGLDGLATGTNQLSRVGNEIYLKSLYIKGKVTIADTTNVVRVMIVQWMKETASFTALQQILFNNSIAGFTWESPYAKEQAGNFKIIWDRTFNLTNVQAPIILFRKRLTRGFKKNIRYNSQIGGNLVVKGALFLVALSDSLAIPNPGIDFETRINFVDI